jgi:hypothetical protein
MFLATLSKLQCVGCGAATGGDAAGQYHGALSCRVDELDSRAGHAPDVIYGEVSCSECDAVYPVLAGVLILSSNPADSLIRHIKGIGAIVPDARIPAAWRPAYLEARESLAEEGFFDEGMEEDLEAERVTALYVMNHYLRASELPHAVRGSSGVIPRLISEHWDSGPLEVTAQWIARHPPRQMVELGSSVGGLAQRVAGRVEGYLGADTSFASVALARHLALGTPYPRKIRFPGDLIDGPVSLEASLPAPAWRGSDRADVILLDVQEHGIRPGQFDLSVALGLIDMLEDPSVLVSRQHEVLTAGGHAIEASPLIWHAPVASALRARFGPGLSSADVVQALYRDGGFVAGEGLEGVPWVFFKHLRQAELYSVHWSVHRRAPGE